MWELEVISDRERIARDLHDQVIQRLFGIGLAMQGTQRRMKQPAVVGRMTEHIDQLQEVIHDIRSAIFDLQVGPSDTPRLRHVLHSLIDELTADTAIRTTVRMAGPLDILPPRMAEDTQAVIREAVSNAVRHGRPTEITVTVSVDDNLVIDISDDGIGIPKTVARSGLHNLSRRAAGCGGTLTIGNRENGGTRLVWTAPLP